MKNDAVSTIRKEFRRSEEARYIHRLHGVFLVKSGASVAEASKLLHEPRRTVAHWITQFDQHGFGGLRDAERSGRPALFTPRQKNKLKTALKKPPTNAGLDGKRWTGELVSQFIQRHFQIELTMRHCRRLLRTLETEITEGKRNDAG